MPTIFYLLILPYLNYFINQWREKESNLQSLGYEPTMLPLHYPAYSSVLGHPEVKCWPTFQLCFTSIHIPSFPCTSGYVLTYNPQWQLSLFLYSSQGHLKLPFLWQGQLPSFRRIALMMLFNFLSSGFNCQPSFLKNCIIVFSLGIEP